MAKEVQCSVIFIFYFTFGEIKQDWRDLLKTKILKCISYFDIFDHPLQRDELLNLCLENGNTKAFDNALNQLVNEQKCQTKHDYYYLSGNNADLIKTRQINQENAKHFFKKLPYYAKIIKSFPFVRGIAISGSLSKNIMFDDGDIDYFIVTAPNRLWISRTLLILFKKVFLFNSKKYFCINYFVDENNLKIDDENIFTAIEITYLVPVYNEDLIKKFKLANAWTKQFFPNFKHPVTIKVLHGENWFKRFLEWILKGRLGNRVDLYFMKMTLNKWKNKFKHFDADKFNLTMRTRRGISKHHPQDFQNRVLEEFKIRLEKLNISE